APAFDAAPPVADSSTWFSLKDALKNGTKGNAIGGSFASNGWTVTSRTDRIWWSVPTLGSGAIELTMANVTLSNMVVSDNEVFSMYEAGFGMGEPLDYAPEYRENHYKTMLRIYGQPESGRPGWQKLMWGMCLARIRRVRVRLVLRRAVPGLGSLGREPAEDPHRVGQRQDALPPERHAGDRDRLVVERPRLRSIGTARIARKPARRCVERRGHA